MTSIEKHILLETLRWDHLTEVDDGTMTVWAALVRKTAPLATKLGFFSPKLKTLTAFNPVSYYGWNPTMDPALREEQKNRAAAMHGLPLELIDEWDSYVLRWKAFLELNPRAKIADMMGDISESHDASSFPHGWEHLIRYWVASGCQGEAPFHRAKHLDEAWQQDLLDTWHKTDGGWVYYGQLDGAGIFNWRR